MKHVAKACAQSSHCVNVCVHGGCFHPDQWREESQWPRLARVSAAPGAPVVAWHCTDHASSCYCTQLRAGSDDWGNTRDRDSHLRGYDSWAHVAPETG